MAISMLQEMPNNTLENYDAVSSKADIESNPPEGLIFHTAAEMEGGGVRIFNVWESREAFERFQDERLLPALREHFGELPPPPEQKITELHHLVAPSR